MAPNDGRSRIERATTEHSDDEILSVLEPEVAGWFTDRFDGFTPPQRYAVREIHDRRNVLISSPTGSGKTLSAFLAAINELAANAKRGELEDRVHVLYISPLKALNNDIERNLQGPLAAIQARIEEAHGDVPEIRVGVRTGDTPRSERQKMTRTPPHILITTPESLGIVLNAPTFSQSLEEVSWVIVDEVHALAENKRGTHLMLSLERLCHRIRATTGGQEPTRIGLSATVHPLDRIASFLVGRDGDGRPRPCLLVDVSYTKDLEIEVLCPIEDLVAAQHETVHAGLYEALDDLIETHRTTLVFTNTRAGTERVVQHLQDRWGESSEDLIGAHHGSMGKDPRHEVEEKLKDGELKAVVTSTSLELGIDIGYVDQVVLLSSPRGVARALQRIGRSGHRLHATSRGVLVALDRDDLVECTVIGQEARQGRLDSLEVPTRCLDVLCQHLVGMSLHKVWEVEEAMGVVRRADPYADLSDEDFEGCLDYLSGHEDLESYNVYPKIWWDEDEGRLGRRGKKTRPIYYTNIGTIPDSTQLSVMAGDTFIGQVEEAFVENLSKGDVFTLGGSTWEYRGASPLKARVTQAGGQQPTVPVWYSEQLPVTFEAAQRVGRFRRAVGRRLDRDGLDATTTWLQDTYELDQPAASALAGYCQEQLDYVGIPDEDTALVEEHVDDQGRAHYIFHTPIGRRAGEALARACAHKVEQMKGCDTSWMVNDYGFVLALAGRARLTIEQVRGLFLMDLVPTLHDAIDDAELLRRRFRHVAGRSLMILRNYLGTDISVGRQNAQGRKLLRHLQRTRPESPVLKETYREILHDALDIEHAKAYLFRFISRQAEIRFVRGLPGPSPFAFNLVAATNAAAVLSDERREALEGFDQTVKAALTSQQASP